MTQGQRRAQDFPQKWRDFLGGEGESVYRHLHKRVAKNVEGGASRINQFVLPKKRYLTNTVGNAPLNA